MNLQLSLFLPRESASVPMARRILATALSSAGVTDDCRSDILLALAEACANAVAHATPVEGYQVTVLIDRVECRIEVLDSGAGFDHTGVEVEPPPVLAESGRGLHIIRAVSDRFDLRPIDPSGTLISFAKRLVHAK